MEILLAGSEGQTLHLTSKAFLRYNSTPESRHIRCHNCSQEATVKRCLSKVSIGENRVPYSLGAVRNIQSITTTPRILPKLSTKNRMVTKL